LAATRNKGDRICPRCTIPTAEFDKLGHQRDMRGRVTRARSYLSDLVSRARDCIYRMGYLVSGAAMERMLRPMSIVPTVVSNSTLRQIMPA
jgi:hypothetical protein